MNFFNQFSILLVTIASSAPYVSQAAAEPNQKVLTLSVGPSDRHLKDVPRLSLSNGPLAEKETTIGVAFDKVAFSKLFVDKIIEQGEFTYREARNFRNSQVQFIIKQVGVTESTKTFSLAPNAPAEGIIEPSEFLLDVEAEVAVQFDVYLCSKANNDCVFEKMSSERLRVVKDNVFVKHNFRRLVRCLGALEGFVEVQGSIDHPEIQRLVLDRISAQDTLKVTLGMITTKSTPVHNGAEFTGFKTFVMTLGEDQAVKMEVTRENDKLRVARSVGEYGISKNFVGCINYP